MSKAQILKEFVSQKLAVATQDILAAVEGIVAGYEEEASCLREQIDRQRMQLELLQQPRARPISPGENRSRTQGDQEEEEREKQQQEEEEQEEEGGTEDDDNNSVTSDTLEPVDLQICFLENPRTKVLTKNVLKKCPMLTLKCPRSLRDSDLLDVIRSTVPQVAGQNQPFDILTSDRGQSLQCLAPKTWTLEEIFENINSAGGRTSTIFIRPKLQKETEKMEEESNLEKKDSTSAAPMWPCADSPQASYLQEEKDKEEDEEEEVAKEKGCIVNVLLTSSTSEEEHNMVTEEANDDNLRMLPVLDSVFCPAAQSENEVKERNHLRPDEGKEKNQDMTTTKQENSDDIPLCKVCGAVNSSDAAFVQHVWSHVDDAGSVCGICGEHLETTEFLKDHLQQCHKSHHPSFSSVDEHVTTQSDQTLQKCNLCQAAFVSKMSLENHQKSHEEPKPQEELKKKMHMCGVCGKSLSDYRSLTRHKMIHSGERPHRCQVCGRSFKLAGTLRQHEKIHMDRERSYLCDVCCKMFLTSKQLQIHMRTHTDEKPYRCNQCGRGFNTKGTLTIHMRIHTGETPYRCPDCGWAFKRKSNLDNHVTTHSGVKAYICSVCGKACARKTHLNVHMRTHNGERPYKCTLCDKAFTQSHCLKTHMKSHRKAEAVT